MIKKVLTVAKNLKIFSIDDVLMFTGVNAPEAESILSKLVTEQQLRYENEKYIFISKPVYKSTIIIKETKIEAKNITSDLNFVNASKLFLQEYVNKNCSMETQRTYSSLFRNNLDLYFKDFLLEDITIDDVNQFRETFQKRGYSEKRIKNSVALLNQLLKYFRNSGYSEKLCEFQVKRVNDKRQKEIVILDEKIIKQAKRLAKKYSKTLYLIIEIILNSGLKFYEILALDEFDIDFENKKIFVQKTSPRGLISQIKAKNKRRNLDFSKEIESVLREFVSHKKASEKMIREYFAKVKQELGLNDFKMDDFRHTFAANFLKQNNSIEKLYLQFGDYSIQATIDKYQKFVM